MSQVPVTIDVGGQMMQFEGTGLEDFGMSDAVLPRIRIEHKEGVWKDNLANSPMPELFFIALGLVKQRVLFHPNVEDGDVPMCKSSDFQSGYPNLDAPRNKSFPWEKSGFNMNDFPAVSQDGQRVLPCNGCQLKEWGSHPVNESPYCAEQWTMPIYYDASGQPGATWNIEYAEWTPAILTLQKSSLKPIKTYLTSFKNSNKPPFLNVCKATLKMIERGDVIYSVPTFSKHAESPRERWLEFSEQYGEMKGYLQRPPVRDEEGGEASPAPSNNTNQAPQQTYQNAPPQQQPQQTYQQPPAPQAPVQQAPPPQQQAPQQPWEQAPAAQAPPQQQTPPPAQPAPQQAAPTGDPWSAPPPQPQAGDPWSPPQQSTPAQPAPPEVPATPATPQAPEQPSPPQAPAPEQPAAQAPPQQQPPAAGGGLPF